MYWNLIQALILFCFLAGKTGNVHRNDLRDSHKKLLCTTREVGDHKELVAAIDLGVTKMSDIILSCTFLDALCVEKGIISEPVIFQSKDDKDTKKTSIVGEGTSDEERAMYWILSKFLSHSLATTQSIINNGGGAENIGFLSKQVDLATVMGQDEETVQLAHNLPLRMCPG
jgi:hypothetical protein